MFSVGENDTLADFYPILWRDEDANNKFDHKWENLTQEEISHKKMTSSDQVSPRNDEERGIWALEMIRPTLLSLYVWQVRGHMECN